MQIGMIGLGRMAANIVAQLRAAGHEVVDFGAHVVNPTDDYADFVVPLARAVAAVQGVEDDDMNIICMGGRTVGPAVAWDLVQACLAATFSHAERHERRLSKVAVLEGGRT